MSRVRPLTLADLPLYASDEDIGEAVLGVKRRCEFKGLAELHERHGMPKVSLLWGGRYVPGVKMFLDVENGIAPKQAIPQTQDGAEGSWKDKPKNNVRKLRG